MLVERSLASMTVKAKQEKKELKEFQDEQQFHEREWAVQRAGWILLCTFVVAGFTGIFGDGPLAEESIDTPAGQIAFDRFVRRDAPTEWIVTPDRGTTSQRLRIAIDAGLVSKFEIHAITPEPAETRLEGNEIVFQIEALDPSGRVLFHVEPRHAGLATGTFRIGETPAAPLQLVVYP